MRWFTPVFTAAIALSLAACSPAEAPPDDTVTPPSSCTRRSASRYSAWRAAPS